MGTEHSTQASAALPPSEHILDDKHSPEGASNTSLASAQPKTEVMESSVDNYNAGDVRHAYHAGIASNQVDSDSEPKVVENPAESGTTDTQSVHIPCGASSSRLHEKRHAILGGNKAASIHDC